MHTTSLVALLAIAGSSILPSLAAPTPGNTLQYLETRDIIGELQRRADTDLLTRGEPVPPPTTPGPTPETPETPVDLDEKDKKKKKKKKKKSTPPPVTTRDVADDELFTRADDDKDKDKDKDKDADPTVPALDADVKPKHKKRKEKKNLP